jgi:ATP-dependent helicase HrpB
VLARRTRSFGALLLEDRPLQPVPAEAAAAAMLAGVRQLGIEALPWDRDSRNLQARLEFLRQLERAPHGPWPASDDASLFEALDEWLPPWLEGMTRPSGAPAARRSFAGATQRPAATCAR